MDETRRQPGEGPGPPAPRARPCPHCGEPGDRADSYCRGCGRPLLAEETLAGPGDLARVGCRSCGARLRADASTRATECPFCDTPMVVELPEELREAPDPEYVVPFAQGADEVRARFRAWVAARSWCHPADLAACAREEDLRGVYLPFWCFNFQTESSFSVEIGEHWWRREELPPGKDGKRRHHRVRETEWYPLEGTHVHDDPAVAVFAGHGLSESEARSIGGFRLEGFQPYHPRFLVGWASEECARPREQARREARARVQREEHRRVAAFLPGDTHRSLEVGIHLVERAGVLALLPVHVLAYRYRGRVYRYLVNGQSGWEAGQRPVAWMRVGAALLAVLALLALAVLAWRTGGTP